MDEEQKEFLEQMKKSFDSRLNELEEKLTAEKQEEHEPKNKKDDGKPATAEEILALFRQETDKKNAEAFQFMIDQEVEAASKINGWEDYYKGEDELGNVRSEKINELSPQDQIKAINRLKENLIKANVNNIGGSGGGSSLSKKIDKESTDYGKKFNELKAEKFDSSSEFNSELMNLITEEKNALLKLLQEEA